MPALYLVTPRASGGGQISAADINQLVNTLTGNQNTPVSIKNTDPIAYTLQLQNTDAAGKTLLAYGPDGTTVILRSQGNGVVASPDGTAAAPIVTTTHAQTLTNKTFTAPHFTAPVVDSGGLTVTAGGLTVTAGGVTVAAGGIALNGGNMALATGQFLANTGTTSARLRLKDLGTVAVNAFVTVEDVLGSLGLLIVTYGGGSVAGFLLTGGGHTTTLLFGDATLWSTVFGSANKINVNWNTAQYMLENKTAASNTFETMLFSTS